MVTHQDGLAEWDHISRAVSNLLCMGQLLSCCLSLICQFLGYLAGIRCTVLLKK
jgi:hypothetical protein